MYRLKIEYKKQQLLPKNPLRQRSGRLPVFLGTARGSFTVEASVALPVFLIVLASLLQLFAALSIESKLHYAMENVGRKLSYYYYAVDELTGEEERSAAKAVVGKIAFLPVSETVVRSLVQEELGGIKHAESFLENGLDGISFLLSEYDEKTESIVLRANYHLKVAFLPVRTLIPCSLVSVHRVWTGRKHEKAEEEELVYITENGKVYHTMLSCTHLSLSIRDVPLERVGTLRNSSGAIYYPCERCGGNAATVYLTTYGDRYHSEKTCPGLKRTIESIPISEAGDRTLCKTCAERSR